MWNWLLGILIWLFSFSFCLFCVIFKMLVKCVLSLKVLMCMLLLMWIVRLLLMGIDVVCGVFGCKLLLSIIILLEMLIVFFGRLCIIICVYGMFICLFNVNSEGVVLKIIFGEIFRCIIGGMVICIWLFFVVICVC